MKYILEETNKRGFYKITTGKLYKIEMTERGKKFFSYSFGSMGYGKFNTVFFHNTRYVDDYYGDMRATYLFYGPDKKLEDVSDRSSIFEAELFNFFRIEE